MTRIDKVLIANRGEIALRILHSLREMGIGSVAVYHAVDADGPAVRAADRAVEIFGETPVAAYLDAEAIIDACRATGADAVHPGYGFLAENADFARKLAAAGITFIGPDPDTIDLMGDKLKARAMVAAHGFPVAPSAEEGAEGDADFLDRARAVGFPLLIKAAAGGGGKGMRIVTDEAALAEELDRARGEATRYFGDGRVYCERYIERPRHIEVQVLADHHGTCLHLWERECSIQRRFQKIVEESPSPALDADARAEICAAAVGIAQAADYRNAGTVEFILAPDGSFYFLEMNTRLQVEHPVTEMITGLDLVAEQLRIARGEKLAFSQADVASAGHAIECRIYAEDADAGHVPATGKLLMLRPPVGPGIRFDAGLIEGQAVTAAFDPMIAKLIVHGPSRADAIARARRALGDLVCLGVTTNVAYLARILGQPAFAEGATHTHFLDEQADALAPPPLDAATRDALLAAASLGHGQLRAKAESVPPIYAAMGAWRN